MTVVQPVPGAYGVTPTYGSWYDQFIGSGIRWFTATEDQYHHWHDATVNHAVIYVGEVAGYDKLKLVEARPGGARLSDWDEYGDSMIWVNKFVVDEAHQRQIVRTALMCAQRKIGYNYLDFLAIGLAQKRMHHIIDYNDAPWWAERLSDPDRLICSQLVDYCYEQASIILFNDHRPTGLVSPADLLALSEQEITK